MGGIHEEIQGSRYIMHSKEDYCKCRNQVRGLTRKAVKSQEDLMAKKSKSNSKIFWKFVNSKTKVLAHT